MNLRNWASSSSEVREALPDFHIDPSSAISILGILWNQYADEISN